MSEATIRAAIKTVVEGVTDIGIVHDYERFASEWDAFLDLFRIQNGDGAIRGWTIGYAGFTVMEPMEFGNNYHREHYFKIRGYLQLDDSEESEKTAAALAEDVCDALDADTAIRSNYYVEDAGLLFETRVFGGVLCHYAEITLNVTEKV